MNDIHTQINKLVNRISHNANILLTRPLLVEFFDGDHKAAIMLNQILYWTDRTRDPEGKFYKTHADWKRELAFSEYQVRRVIWGDPRVQYPKRNLSDIGLSVHVKMAPNGRNATYYHLDVAQFMAIFIDWLEQRFGAAVDQVLKTMADIIQEPSQEPTAQPKSSKPKPKTATPQSTVAQSNTLPQLEGFDFDEMLAECPPGENWVIQPYNQSQLDKSKSELPPIEPTERVTETYQKTWQLMNIQLEMQFGRADYNHIKKMMLVDIQATEDRYQLFVVLPNQYDCEKIQYSLNRNIRRAWSDTSHQPMAQVDLIAMTEEAWRERTKQ